MTAPVRAITVATSEVTSYTELIGGIEAKRQALGIKQTDFDELAGFAEGLWGKVSGLLQVKQIRVEKLFDAMRAAGLRLRLEEDPEQDAKMRDRIASKYNPRQANQARPGHSATLPSTAVLSRILSPIGRMGGKKRWHKTTQEERSAHMRMMAMAGVRKRRKEMKKRARQRKRAHQARKEAAREQVVYV